MTLVVSFVQGERSRGLAAGGEVLLTMLRSVLGRA